MKVCPPVDLTADLAIALDDVPLEQLADYAAIAYFLNTAAAETDTPRPYLEAFYHLVQQQDWRRSLQVMFWVPDGDMGEEFHIALGYWGYYPEQLEIYEALLYQVNAQCDMACLNGLGHYFETMGNFKRAITFHQEHLALAQQQQDFTGQWLALVGLGNAAESLMDLAGAADYFQQALAIAVRCDDVTGQVVGLGSLAKVYRGLGDIDAAVTHGQQSVELAQQRGLTLLEMSGLLLWGQALMQLEAPPSEVIEAHYQRALTLAEQLESLLSVAEACWYLGDLYNFMDRDAAALAMFEQGLAVARDIGAIATEGNILRGIANVYCKLGDLDRGEFHFAAWRSLAASVGDLAAQRLALEGLALIADHHGELDQAIAYEEQRLEICQELNDLAGMAATTAYLGYGYMTVGAFEPALKHLLAALNFQQQLNDLDGIQITLKNLEVLQSKLVSG